MYQPQEEAGSAVEQPASNKADAYTIVKEVEQSASFLYYRFAPWLKKPISDFTSLRYYSFLISYPA